MGPDIAHSRKRLELAEFVAERYRNVEHIDSVAVGGSTAIGSAYLGSDLDLWATYARPPDPGERTATILEIVQARGGEAQPTYASSGQVDALRLDGIDVIIMLGPSDSLARVADDIQESLGAPKECYAAEYHYIRTFASRPRGSAIPDRPAVVVPRTSLISSDSADLDPFPLQGKVGMGSGPSRNRGNLSRSVMQKRKSCICWCCMIPTTCGARPKHASTRTP